MKTFTVKDLLQSSNFDFGTSITVGDIIFSLILTFLLALFIFYIYKKTYAGVLYSRDFNVTLIIVSLVVSAIMMGISSNLALSLGMIGALSIVRFRTAVKDPKDITFLFWSISVGLINGVQFYKLSIVASLFIGGILLFLSKKFVIQPQHVLVLRGTNLEIVAIGNALKKNCLKYNVSSTTIDEDIEEKVIQVKIKKGKKSELLNELKKIHQIKTMNLFSYSGELSE